MFHPVRGAVAALVLATLFGCPAAKTLEVKIVPPKAELAGVAVLPVEIGYLAGPAEQVRRINPFRHIASGDAPGPAGGHQRSFPTSCRPERDSVFRLCHLKRSEALPNIGRFCPHSMSECRLLFRVQLPVIP